MKKIIATIPIIVLIIACNSNSRKKNVIDNNQKPTVANTDKTKSQDQKEKELTSVKHNQTGEDFLVFLENFKEDSVFRYTRIQFPISGFNSDAEASRENYKWSKVEWEFYFEEDLKYKNDENVRNVNEWKDSLATWRLYKEDSGYDVQYDFNLKDKKWFLNYYSHKNF